MKHTLLAGFAALITTTTLLGAEPKPDTAPAIHPTNPGRAFMMNAKIGNFVFWGCCVDKKMLFKIK